LTCEHCGQEVEWETLELPESIPPSAVTGAPEVLPRNFFGATGEGMHGTAWRSALRFLRGLTGWSPL
jgi:hypothetical protein